MTTPPLGDPQALLEFRDHEFARLRRSAKSSPTALRRSALHKVPISAIETMVTPTTKC